MTGAVVLAGLWLAPLVEANLPGMFSILILTPAGRTGVLR